MKINSRVILTVKERNTFDETDETYSLLTDSCELANYHKQQLQFLFHTALQELLVKSSIVFQTTFTRI
jgi:hypothetical protein